MINAKEVLRDHDPRITADGLTRSHVLLLKLDSFQGFSF